MAGALTLSIMILPLIMRTTEEALKSVPDTFREGSFGLGAGKLRTVFKIVLPSAIPGILAGVILAVGRIVGETAALIYTAGAVAQVPTSVMSSGSTLAVHMYNLSREGLYMDQAYAVSVILLLLVPVSYTHLDVYKRQKEALSALSTNFDVRKVAACVREHQETFYILCGWMTEKDALAFQKDIENDAKPVSYTHLDVYKRQS